MEELIDVLDENGNKTGIVKSKSQVKKDGDFHRAISVCIINRDGEVLLQKRSMNKRVYPGLWSMFLKGHVKANESIREALTREIQEEIGLTISSYELAYLYTIYDENIEMDYQERIFFDTFMLIKDIDIKNIKMNDEVEKVQFVSLKDLYTLINQHKKIVPNYLDYDRIFPYIVYALEDLNIKDKVLKK